MPGERQRAITIVTQLSYGVVSGPQTRAFKRIPTKSVVIFAASEETLDTS